MTSVTIATHPTPKLVAGIIGVIGLSGAPWVQDMIGYIVSQLPYLSSRDVSGYAFFSSNITGPDGKNGTASYSGMGGEFMVHIPSGLSPAVANLASICNSLLCPLGLPFTQKRLEYFPSMKISNSEFLSDPRYTRHRRHASHLGTHSRSCQGHVASSTLFSRRQPLPLVPILVQYMVRPKSGR